MDCKDCKYGVFESYSGVFDDTSLVCVTDTSKNADIICSALSDFRNKQGRTCCFRYSTRRVPSNTSYCRYIINDSHNNFICAVDDIKLAKQFCSVLGNGYSFSKIVMDFVDFLDDENFFDNWL